MIFTAAGRYFEGICLHNYIPLYSFPVYFALWLLDHKTWALCFWTLAVALQFLVQFKYGNIDFSKYNPSGPYKVGYRDWTTKTT